jgi:hypothetical protein
VKSGHRAHVEGVTADPLAEGWIARLRCPCCHARPGAPCLGVKSWQVHRARAVRRDEFLARHRCEACGDVGEPSTKDLRTCPDGHAHLYCLACVIVLDRAAGHRGRVPCFRRAAQRALFALRGLSRAR